jgi:ketosteroid isomerase-like protein
VAVRNVEVIGRIFPAEADLAAVMRSDDPVAALGTDPEAIAPGMEVRFAASQAGADGFEGRGIEGLIEGWRDWLIAWESYVLTVEQVIEAGDKVLMLVRVRARTSRDSVELEHNPAAVWTVTDGQATAVTFFLQREDAFQFAGIEQESA